MRRLTTLSLVAYLALAACSEAASVPTTTAPSTTVAAPASSTTSVAGPTTTVAPGEDPFAPPGEATGDAIDGAGTFQRTLTIDGEDRDYVVHVSPAAWGGEAVPLVIDLHGLSSSPESQDELSDFRAKADAEGFVVAQPQAAGLLPTWQAGIVPSPDVGFIRLLIADIGTSVDLGPVFAAGFSNGAGMAHRLACDAPGDFAAIGTVAGAYPDTGPCLGAMPVISFHGERDLVVPFEGAGTLLPPIVEWATSWAERNGCDGLESTEVAAGVERLEWTGCTEAPVELYVIADGRHGWPGTESPSRLFNSTSEISATDVMWEFFVDSTG